ncbi:hypothetical protein D3C85_1527880 [compost metagenome]
MITVGRSCSYRPLMIENSVVSSKSLGVSLLTPISSRMSSDGLIRPDRIQLSLRSLDLSYVARMSCRTEPIVR